MNDFEDDEDDLNEMNEYSTDDEAEDDLDEDLPSSEEDEQQVPSLQSAKKKLDLVNPAIAKRTNEVKSATPVIESDLISQRSNGEDSSNAPTPTQSSSAASENLSAERTDSPGKRTKGLPMKGIKRAHLPTASGETGSDSDESLSKRNSNVPKKQRKQVLPNTAMVAPITSTASGGGGGGGETAKCWWPESSNTSSPSGGFGGDWRNEMSSSPAGSSGLTGPSTAMTELANLVNAHPRSAGGPLRMQMNPEILDMRPVLRNFVAQQELALDEAGLSGDNESLSSRLSDKNLGDFEDENSVDEDVLHLAQTPDLGMMLHQQQQLAMASLYKQRLQVPRLTVRQQREEARILAHYKLEAVCEKGNTLLWDLLQDSNISQLSDGLAMEAEKALSGLLCFNIDKIIRLKFIEGCINNVAKNDSAAISLRLLPKLIQSFHSFRGMDTSDVCMFTEKRHKMTQLFFSNLQIYQNEFRSGIAKPFFSHMAQIQVRLHFLTVIFSSQVSPMDFRLTNEQINILWECLASDPACSDDFFQWLLMQIHSKDQHAISLEGFKLIYEEKLPSLKPETISMLGLNLFSQLCQLNRNTSQARGLGLEQEKASSNIKMEQLWKIALCANNTDVSMKAIQILNSVYFGQGEEFLNTCMRSLKTNAEKLDSGNDDILIQIQRALLLLKTYLETFRRKYAYNFRRMSIDGQGVSTHSELVDMRTSGNLRVSVQAAGFPSKVTIEMQSSDQVADLRAEIIAWWDGKTTQQRNGAHDVNGGGSSPLFGAMLNEGPLRIITQGQELSTDLDEKSLMEMGFKDMQMVFVSQGAMRGGPIGTPPKQTDLPPFPGREKMPMNLLLFPIHFEQLFELMQSLSEVRVKNDSGHLVALPKAQNLSRRVWDILLLLPTNPVMKQSLQTINANTADKTMKTYLNPEFPQKLMYSLYIIDWLGRPARLRRRSGVIDPLESGSNKSQGTDNDQPWINRFVAAGGLKHLFNIFLSGELQKKQESLYWCEWRQECLSSLLRLLVQFGVDVHDYEALADQILEATTSPKKRSKRNAARHESGVHHSDRLLVPRLSQTMLDLMNVECVMPRLISVFLDVSCPKDQNPAHFRASMFGRAPVVHFAMSLLVAWLYSVDDIEDVFFASNGLPAWLRNLLLEDPDPAVRRELCTGLYRMCMGSTTNARTGQSCTAPLLSILLEFLDDALVMTPMRREALQHPLMHIEDGKEPFGPACRDYFWILCRLVDNLRVTPDHPDTDPSGLIDLDQLAGQLVCGLVTRKVYEKRHGDASPDDTLIGTLNLLCCVMKHEPAFKTSPEGQEFLIHLYRFLFDLPTPEFKDLPKCKSSIARTSCYDLMFEMCKGSIENYLILHGKLLEQHHSDSHKPYPWEYWPRDDGRAECGYVGLTNLGATCYMASCVQQLYMIPQARASILKTKVEESNNDGKHLSTLQELQRMFAYLRESERKAYNPLSFCKTYQMDHLPLNTGEQKDMAEFFIDLLSKIEDMSPDLKTIIKKLFCGTLTNNVVSLDCNHVSRTAEEFYTVRCQVAEMRNLHQSLEEVTVKDTLEGDNMYTCSGCDKKVRAEKRACFKDLPKIIAFNTMRYTFNMLTMLKEKVNTHFSFPFRLDMSPYMEENLIPNDKQDVKKEANSAATPEPKEPLPKKNEDLSYEYELIGVTVHTGTADGGHYYAFIRDRSASKDKWYSFNDAEVKAFDPNQIASECFGGEMNSRTYDQVTDKFMDLSIEKTNSAYMLFYERIDKKRMDSSGAGPSSASGTLTGTVAKNDSDEGDSTNPEDGSKVAAFNLSEELETWIWEDNTNFIQDNNIFDHTYFNFMWQMAGYIPTSLGGRHKGGSEDITLMSAKLATSFFLESFIHAKEKLNIVQWVELLTKQFDSSTEACCWFLDHMSADTNWPITIFLKCQVNTIRQMFHRLCIHVIQKFRAIEKDNYLLPWSCKDLDSHPTPEIRAKIGSTSPITRFIRMLLGLLDSGAARPHLKYLTEIFRFLHDFAKLGEEEMRFLLSINAISSLVEFYLKIIKQGNDNLDVHVLTDDEDDEDDDIIALTPINEANKLASLDKMVWLIAVLVEKSRGDDNRIHLSDQDMASLVGTGGKSLVFLYNVTKDNINTCQTCNLIFSLTRNNQDLAEQIANMVFHGVKQPEYSMHFFRLLTLLTELSGGPSGMPCFTSLVMHKIWDLAKTSPQPALEWLSLQVARNRYVQTWLLSTMDTWVEPYLMAHPNQKVRNAAAFLVVSLVPSPHFRQAFRSARTMPLSIRETLLTAEEMESLHQILEYLFSLLPNAKNYIDLSQHGSAKLVAYFSTISHCVLTRTEKRMFEPHFVHLWHIYHPKLSEPSIPVHHNKQALLSLWYTLCLDCPENVALIFQNQNVTKNIAFNYILADHDDQEVVTYNRVMLPAYYGLLRLCCQQSKDFTRQLAQHQNIQWAFKNITPYTTQYNMACEELFKLMKLFVQKREDMSEEEESEIRTFRHQTIQTYLSILDARTSWSTLINVLKILVDTNEDRIFVVYNNGMALIFDAINMLHMMFHEATACHVTGEIIDLLSIFNELLGAVRASKGNSEVTQILSRWKDMSDMTSRILTLCNTFTPPEMRDTCLAVIKEMLMLWPQEMLNILVPLLHRSHSNASDSEPRDLGPYFPRKGVHALPALNLKAVRPPRPMIQMMVPASQLDANHDQDPDYDRALNRYYLNYHSLIDLMVRLAVNEDNLTKMLVDLSAMVGLDGVPLHYQLFPKLWLDIFNTEQIDRKFIMMLISSHGFLEYVDAVLLDERASLNNSHIFNFLLVFFPKVSDQVLTDQVQGIITELVSNFIGIADKFNLTQPNLIKHLNGEMKALLLVNSARPDHMNAKLLTALKILKTRVEADIAKLDRDAKQDDALKRKESQGGKEAQIKSKESEETKEPSSSKNSSSKASANEDLARKRRKSSGGILESHSPDALHEPKLKKRHCSSAAEAGGLPAASLTSRSTATSSGFSPTDQTRLKLREALTSLLGTLTLLTQLCSDRIRIMEEADQSGPSSAKPRSSDSASPDMQVDNRKGSSTSESKPGKSDTNDP
ncbi:ubiquitin carboxyl-terminal hydrolase puf-like [Tigriopus californicus]|uniref:ubiquitin carboxyl-terminal hydrolase puf-like n=1 Tax=Tigriopus californicus TaxID=6832 RepID=UPI0027DA546E|nr:ubiquitin carboxyl-terminal hydrolase puf-like [Tigriopus californicus]